MMYTSAACPKLRTQNRILLESAHEEPERTPKRSEDHLRQQEIAQWAKRKEKAALRILEGTQDSFRGSQKDYPNATRGAR